MDIRVMKSEDYDKLYELWMTIKGFGIRSIDDSREGVTRFLKRNPTTSITAWDGDTLIGAILCGHDGRRGCLYHVCVRKGYRRQGVGKAMVVAFTKNDIGNAFWNKIGWTEREDLNYYDFTLNEKNITAFIEED